MITPSSLHYVATTRGSYIPDIDPREHRLMIHGMVDCPLTFTLEDLKRLPSVTRPHFIGLVGYVSGSGTTALSASTQPVNQASSSTLTGQS